MAQIVYIPKKVFNDFQKGKISLGDVLITIYDMYRIELRGGLDHFEITKNQIIIHDRGMNNKANDLIVRKLK